MSAPFPTREKELDSALAQLEIKIKNARDAVVRRGEGQAAKILYGSIRKECFAAEYCLSGGEEPHSWQSLKECSEARDCTCAIICAINLAAERAEACLKLIQAIIEDRLRPDEDGETEQEVERLAEYVEATPERRAEMDEDEFDRMEENWRARQEEYWSGG